MATLVEEIAKTPDPIRLFGDYLRVTGIARTQPALVGDEKLIGKRVGLVNGSSWVTLWSTWFGRRFLPGAHLINVGNEAIQVNFMEAHADNRPCPPQSNIDAVTRYARDVVELGHVDAVMLTCSTMNRAYKHVQQALAETKVPVIQIDQPMMRRAVEIGGRVLVVATHGPTVNSTQALLRETANEMGGDLDFGGITVEDAWHHLDQADINAHNSELARALRSELRMEKYSCVVLAQLSMAALLFTYPDPMAHFGLPVLTSAQCGFEYLRGILTSQGTDSFFNKRFK